MDWFIIEGRPILSQSTEYGSVLSVAYGLHIITAVLFLIGMATWRESETLAMLAYTCSFIFGIWTLVAYYYGYPAILKCLWYYCRNTAVLGALVYSISLPIWKYQDHKIWGH